MVFALASLAGGVVRADSLPRTTLFDPARHMHVSEVKPGMKGYGMTVFQGTRIEKFDVEVIGVVKNFNPKYDVVLIRCKGDFLEHTGAIEGMSGSPIFLYDEGGRARMIGAFAYGWPLCKDPLAGVQPIEYMLSLPTNEPGAGAEAASPNAPAGDGSQAAGRVAPPRWSLDDLPAPWGHGPGQKPAADGASYRSPWTGQEIRLQPLATPLMAGKISAAALARIAPTLSGLGFFPVQAGVGGGQGTANDPPPPLEPGSVLAVPILTGDLELTAIGTCTERIGDRIFGFGHPFLSEGRVALPMGSGSIAATVANLETSFKLGFLSKATGTLTADQTVGVSGRVGPPAPMVPVEIHVVYADRSIDQTYHFSAAVHPKLTPVIASAAVAVAMTGDKSLPEFHTVDYELTLDFENGQSVHIANTSVNEGPEAVVNDVLMTLTATTDNPFQEVPLRRLLGTVRVTADAREAQIISVMVPRSKYEPGETVKGYVSYQPFRAQESILPLELKLPRDLANGDYQFTVSDWSHYLDDERAASPFEFTANNVGEMFAVLKDVASIHRNALYLRLVRRADGMAVGRTAMPRLPSSQRQVLMGSGRSDITPFVSSTVLVVPTDLVMNGSADFTLTIEKHGKVEVAAPRKQENPAPAAGKEENPKSGASATK
ncbi:MAG: hypothetical protein ABR964_00985 [Tepidisphaeraceae bacterium]